MGKGWVGTFWWFMVFDATFNNISVISWQSAFKYALHPFPYYSMWPWGRRGHDRMLVGFTITYVISACHH
jgi:hypothetical protein